MSCLAPRSRAAFLVLGLVLAAGRCWAGEKRAAFEQAFAVPVVKNCLGCHNPGESKGNLDLTRREGLLQGGKSGPVIVPGKPNESYLLERIADGSMPPPKFGTRLSQSEVAAIRAWIQAGASWPAGRVLNAFEFTTDRRAGLDWWSLQPVRRLVPPRARILKEAGLLKTQIDAFILAKLREHGLSPAPEADRVTYLRRAKFDLLGLPPTPQEIDAFVADRSPDAYEKLIDRLLASPHYGERWGRHWLDVVRFGESDGFENDRLRDHAWLYRDYVIRSFNEDKSYPQFVKEQLAGDVLEPVVHAGIAATGFLVAGPWDEVQNVAKSPTERRRAHEEQMEELIGAVGQTFLGLTVNCARCHDHKFDPIPQTDYYRLKAVFDGVDHGNLPLLTPAERRTHDAKMAPLRARVDRLKAVLAEMKDGLVPGRPAAPAPDVGKLQAELKKLETELAQAPVPLSYSGTRRQPEPTVVYLRGDIRKPSQRIIAGGLSLLRSPLPDCGLTDGAPEGQRRVRFAEWVTHPDNPLPARVLVNRVWQYHFGQGLVPMPSDFGFNGGRPSHPELLDWLARQFIADGWSVKRLHRRIMLSATYRQSAAFDPKAAAVDADNRLLWRFTPRRLEAEIVRDAMLAVSGALNPRLGGPSFRPFTITVRLHNFYHPLDKDVADFNRRTVYRMNVNTGRSAFLDSLDCPAPSLSMPRRLHTTTPLQALALMNDSFVQRQAEHLARRVEQAASDSGEQIVLAYRLALGRPPTDEERTESVALLHDHGPATVCWVLLNASEFLYVR